MNNGRKLAMLGGPRVLLIRSSKLPLDHHHSGVKMSPHSFRLAIWFRSLRAISIEKQTLKPIVFPDFKNEKSIKVLRFFPGVVC